MTAPLARKHDRTGRSSAERLAKSRPMNKPSECGFEQWGWFPLEMLEHEAFRALTKNARCLLDRLLIEHLHEGGTENGRLVVTHEQFRQYGLGADSIREAIDQSIAFGFVRAKLGGRWAGTNRPNVFRLTWLGSIDADGNIFPPENAWKGITPDDVARWYENRAQKRAGKRQWRTRKKTERTPETRSTVPLKPGVPYPEKPEYEHVETGDLVLRKPGILSRSPPRPPLPDLTFPPDLHPCPLLGAAALADWRREAEPAVPHDADAWREEFWK